MGREQDLLEAARSGNVTLIEKLLTPRKKMTVGSIPLSLGPFPSLRRMPNPNCHDQNGDTPLHLAALNGYIEIVKMLLNHDASTNVVDCKGCCPLHLAAWSGNADMCRVLLTHGPSTAKVNEQNQAGETALHCAAQYGHTEVVAVLLQNLADPTIRNNQAQSPLDLASQYGRLDTVELLLSQCPGILNDDLDSHSPLHLAARNGHRQVVKVLLDAGFNVNKRTDGGTALHEAAIYGKQDVVCLLLKQGIDVNHTDSINRTVLEALSEHTSQLSLDIGRIILDYIEGRSISDKRSSTQSTCSDLLGEPLYDCPRAVQRHSSDAESHSDRRPFSGRSSTDSSVFGASGTAGRLSAGSESFFIYDVPRSRPVPVEEVDSASDTSDTTHSLPGATSLSQSPGLHVSQLGAGGPAFLHGSSLPSTPETPKKPPRRKAPSAVSKSSVVSSSPPRMVFINKRSSTSSRDSDVDAASKTMKESTAAVVGGGDNNNAADVDVCDNATSTDQRRHVYTADVTNSNHQEASAATSNVGDVTGQRRRETTDNNNVAVGDDPERRQPVDNQEYLDGAPAEGDTVQYRRAGGSDERRERLVS